MSQSPAQAWPSPNPPKSPRRGGASDQDTVSAAARAWCPGVALAVPPLERRDEDEERAGSSDCPGKTPPSLGRASLRPVRSRPAVRDTPVPPRPIEPNGCPRLA